MHMVTAGSITTSTDEKQMVGATRQSMQSIKGCRNLHGGGEQVDLRPPVLVPRDCSMVQCVSKMLKYDVIVTMTDCKSKDKPHSCNRTSQRRGQ